MAPVLAMAALFAALWLPGAAAAQPVPPELDDPRFTFNRVENGFLRLDGRTGQVSLCSRDAAGWACRAVADDRAVLEGEIARLQGENARLKKELIAKNLPLPGTTDGPEQRRGQGEEPRLQLPSDADINRVVTFMEKVWRRLVEMIVTLQKDMQNRS
jgi:hypothetical protein